MNGDIITESTLISDHALQQEDRASRAHRRSQVVLRLRRFLWRLRRLGRIGLLAGVLALWGCTSIGTFVGRRIFSDDGMRDAVYSVRHRSKVTMTTSDGVDLVSEIYLPKGIDVAPTILVRLPLPKGWKNQVRLNVIGEAWASRGYAVVFQGTRGTYRSGGDFYPLVPERRDGIETLRWLAQQPWYNGRIGMWGGSAFGHTQWVLWDQVNPRVSAYAIQIASTNFYKMFYPGGALSLESALYWAVRNSSRKEYVPSHTTLEPGYQSLPVVESDDRVVRDLAFFNDWVTHREKDDYWREIDGENRARELADPVHMLAGWYDAFLPGQLEDFIEIQRHADPDVARRSRLVIGPWGHAKNVHLPGAGEGPDYRSASINLAIPWFDKHLLGMEVAPSAPVRIFVMGINKWRDEESWPLERAAPTTFHLRSEGRLTLEPPSDAEAFDAYAYDPQDPVPSAGGSMLGPRSGIQLQNEIEKRFDVLVYTTKPLTEDVEITGPITLVLYVTTSAVSTDFTGKLVNVYPNGDAYNISDGILRRSYSQDDAKASTPASTRIEIELWPTSTVLLRGHRIRLEVSSSNFPRFDRNPNTGRPIATETKTVVAHQRVYHHADAPSHVVLPLVPRSQSKH